MKFYRHEYRRLQSTKIGNLIAALRGKNLYLESVLSVLLDRVQREC